MTEDDFQNFKLRLSPALYEELKILSLKSRRTMSDEIVARLEQSLTNQAPARNAKSAQPSSVRTEMNELRGQVDILKEAIAGISVQLAVLQSELKGATRVSVASKMSGKK